MHEHRDNQCPFRFYDDVITLFLSGGDRITWCIESKRCAYHSMNRDVYLKVTVRQLPWLPFNINSEDVEKYLVLL